MFLSHNSAFICCNHLVWVVLLAFKSKLHVIVVLNDVIQTSASRSHWGVLYFFTQISILESRFLCIIV